MQKVFISYYYKKVRTISFFILIFHLKPAKQKQKLQNRTLRKMTFSGGIEMEHWAKIG